jgi:hypothetical protein
VPTSADDRPPPDLLDRHQRRREQGIPTISVLCGPTGLGVRRWRAWASGRGVAVVTPRQADLPEICSAWVQVLASTRDLGIDALDWLAAHTGRSPAHLRARLAAMTAHDLDSFWEGLALAPDRHGTAAACRLLLASGSGGELQPRSLAGRLRAAGSGQGLPPEVQSVAGLANLVPSAALPALVLTPLREAGTSEWLAAAGQLLEELVTAVPALAAAVTTEARAFEALSGGGVESHLVAVLREGIVPVQALGASELARRFVAAGVPPAAATDAARCLAEGGASEELAAAFADAARRSGPPATPDDEGAARSAAERFLFERLESMAATAGLFALNRRLDFRHGPAPAEADLLAASLRLVIELDGSFFHLRDAAAYRRDRKKDWELQRRGYLVLRFLSEDVVGRLEEILDTILAAVELRRTLTPTEGEPHDRIRD